ncbi:hypothetical protein J4402_04165 [Candidatus Pacearchaeota archaeon]|nr:hypothetical protein [Candidatus Pacearchaeota archaeon]
MNPKKMAKKLIFLLILLSILPVVTAATLEINIKTYPNHVVFINVAEPSDDYQLLESIKKTADTSGLASATFSSNNYNEIDLYVQINNGNEKIMSEYFSKKSMSEPLYLQIIPGKVNEDYRTLEIKNETVETANQTVEEETNQTTEETVNETIEEMMQNISSEPGITGLAIFKNSDWLSSKTTIWVVGIAAVIAIVVVFLVRRSFLSSAPPAYLPKVQHMRHSGQIMPKPKSATPIDEELLKTEAEIENVRSRIEKIKRIKDAQKRLKEEQDALKSLQDDED